MEEFKRLIASDDLRAMSIASELVSAASSVESSRPFWGRLVQAGGCWRDCWCIPMPTLGPARRRAPPRSDWPARREVMGLFDVAIELLFEGDEKDEQLACTELRRKGIGKKGTIVKGGERI